MRDLDDRRVEGVGSCPAFDEDERRSPMMNYTKIAFAVESRRGIRFLGAAALTTN